MENSALQQAISLWRVNLIRLTAFPSPNEKLSQDWWADVIGELPEAIISKPRIAGFQIVGPFKEGKLILDTNPTRIDWLLSVQDELKVSAKAIPTLGTLPDVLDMFLPICQKWFSLQSCPKIQRIAFGTSLLQPVNDKKSGYDVLSSYLKCIDLDSENSSDFSYQINRPRASKRIEKLMINRLSKWEVITGLITILSISDKISPLTFQLENSAIKLDLDINSGQDYVGEFYPENLHVIFNELIELGKEIAMFGDLP